MALGHLSAPAIMTRAGSRNNGTAIFAGAGTCHYCRSLQAGKCHYCDFVGPASDIIGGAGNKPSLWEPASAIIEGSDMQVRTCHVVNGQPEFMHLK